MKRYRHCGTGETYTAEQIVDLFLEQNRNPDREESQEIIRKFLMTWVEMGEIDHNYDSRLLCHVGNDFEEFLRRFKEIEPETRRRGGWQRGMNFGSRNRLGR